jgi:hypothetical protein
MHLLGSERKIHSSGAFAGFSAPTQRTFRSRSSDGDRTLRRKSSQEAPRLEQWPTERSRRARRVLLRLRPRRGRQGAELRLRKLRKIAAATP